jgi:LPS O-antigen subunit length determinant protein (WzzB/FepE family)
MEKAKEELVHIHRRLDVLIAVASDDMANRKNEFAENMSNRKGAFTESMETRMEDLKSGIEDKMERLKTAMTVSAEDKAERYEKFENMKAEYQELRAKYSRNVEERSRLAGVKDFIQRDLIRSNPTMTSKRFREALEELKNRTGKAG